MQNDDAVVIAKGLTKAQRHRLQSFRTEPRQMGIGMMQFLPGCVEPVGTDHPIFGPHYALNDFGRQVKSILENSHG
jgi:hypothetical protein